MRVQRAQQDVLTGSQFATVQIDIAEGTTIVN